MNTKKEAVRIAAGLMMMGAAVAAGADDAGDEKLSKVPEKSAVCTVKAVPGDTYSHVKWFFIIPVKLQPQMAVWVEDETGRVVRTLYVTQKAADGSWSGGADERPDALPIYTHRSAAGDVDEVSGATPKASEERSLRWETTLEKGGEYTFYVEVNASFDYNDTYGKETSGVNGQPSLLYAARLSPAASSGTASNRSIAFEAVGHGTVDGTAGTVERDLRGITDARSILKKVRLTLERTVAGR